MSNSLASDPDRCSVSPDLGPNCWQRLSTYHQMTRVTARWTLCNANCEDSNQLSLYMAGFWSHLCLHYLPKSPIMRFCSIMCWNILLSKVQTSITQDACHLLCLQVLPADNLCKQFGPRSGPTYSRSRSGSKLFDTDSIHERIFWKSWFWKKSADDKKACKITQDASH